MSNDRHLRFLITSALLVGPALGCGGPEPEANTVAPTETTESEGPNVNMPVDHDPPPVIDEPTANPVPPSPDPEAVPEEDPELNVGEEDF